jgi:hypothetical protein
MARELLGKEGKTMQEGVLGRGLDSRFLLSGNQILAVNIKYSMKHSFS